MFLIVFPSAPSHLVNPQTIMLITPFDIYIYIFPKPRTQDCFPWKILSCLLPCEFDVTMELCQNSGYLYRPSDTLLLLLVNIPWERPNPRKDVPANSKEPAYSGGQGRARNTFKRFAKKATLPTLHYYAIDSYIWRVRSSLRPSR